MASSERCSSCLIHARVREEANEELLDVFQAELQAHEAVYRAETLDEACELTGPWLFRAHRALLFQAEVEQRWLRIVGEPCRCSPASAPIALWPTPALEEGELGHLIQELQGRYRARMGWHPYMDVLLSLQPTLQEIYEHISPRAPGSQPEALWARIAATFVEVVSCYERAPETRSVRAEIGAGILAWLDRGLPASEKVHEAQAVQGAHGGLHGRAA
jgi:hypothetical protein